MKPPIKTLTSLIRNRRLIRNRIISNISRQTETLSLITGTITRRIIRFKVTNQQVIYLR